MIPTKRQFLKHLAKVFDLCVLVCSFVFASIAYALPKGVTLAGLLALRITLANCLLFTLLLIGWHNLFAIFGLYISKRMTSRRAELIEISKATVAASAFLIISARIFHIGIVTPPFALVFLFSTACGMIFGRLAIHSLLLTLRRRGKNRRFLLIVGTNERAIEFARQITERPSLATRSWVLSMMTGEEYGNSRQPVTSAVAPLPDSPNFFGTMLSTKRQCTCHCDRTTNMPRNWFPNANITGS